MAANPEQPKKIGRSGWGFLLLVCLFSCLLLLINGAIVAGCSPWLSAFAMTVGNSTPRWLNGHKIMQVLIFALPIVMLFVEWAIVDFVVDHLPRNDSQE